MNALKKEYADFVRQAGMPEEQITPIVNLLLTYSNKPAGYQKSILVNSEIYYLTPR